MILGLGAGTTLAGVFAYSRFVLPWQRARMESAKGNYHVMVDRSGKQCIDRLWNEEC
jgi:hypothetical protein